ncbi:HAMP domain-containing sensor histidine kinase [Streptomyces sp. V4-01]|uniref:histidine kinase n=1 Tax=Actinacidiphila polyblastidii TaxID=3110430 RepID=A0ABU7PCQ4_9ACTN|nr:HAMP domain-containing sensor histidine kinase [Streptomyces sp. V4-01]
MSHGPPARTGGHHQRDAPRRRRQRAQARVTSVHSRVLGSIVAVTGCAVLVFTVPLAVAADHIHREDAVARVQRDAIWAAAGLRGEAVRAPVPAGLRPASRGTGLGVYGPSGRLVYGSGPHLSPVAGRARDGELHQSIERGHLAVAVPVFDAGRVRAVVRAWTPWDPVADSIAFAWLVLAALGLVVVALSVLLAWRLARRVATPLERLTATARALGSGDFGVQPERTGIREADAAWQALAATARRLGDLLERQSRFSTAVSHQLRTPLTSLMLGLEAAQWLDDAHCRQALATAMRRAEHLGDTIDDLLRLARETHRRDEPTRVADVLDRIAERNGEAVREAGRVLAVRCQDGLPAVSASQAAVVQILDTLVDNALVHGRGRITLTATDVGTGVALEVGDEGPGPARAGDGVFGSTQHDGHRHGIGLPLARSLAEAEGGRLLLRRPGPRPVFSLMLPAHAATADPGDRRAGSAGAATQVAGQGCAS